MHRHLKPEPGNWYKHRDKGQLFRVISVDEKEALIEIQHFDGDLEELESAEWFGMDLEPAAEPEDWTGPVDDVETDDLGYSETEMKEKDWQETLEANPKPAEEWQDETAEEERDELAEGTPKEELYSSEPPRTLRGRR
jgi:hypothetical protein